MRWVLCKHLMIVTIDKTGHSHLVKRKNWTKSECNHFTEQWIISNLLSILLHDTEYDDCLLDHLYIVLSSPVYSIYIVYVISFFSYFGLYTTEQLSALADRTSTSWRWHFDKVRAWTHASMCILMSMRMRYTLSFIVCCMEVVILNSEK